MSRKQWVARLRCLRCGHRWEQPPGPASPFWIQKGAQEGDPQKYADRFCPACGHLYAKWENWAAFAGIADRERKKN